MRIVITILALWVVGLGGWLLYQQYWPGATGTIVVVSDPPGAEILLDLKETGLRAPSNLDVSRGKHSVKVRQAGKSAEPFVEVVEVEAGDVDSVFFVLTDAPTQTDTASAERELAEQVPQVRTVPPREQPIEERVEQEMPWDVPRNMPRSVDSLEGLVDPEQDLEAAVDSLIRNRPEQTTVQRDPDKIIGSVEVASSVPGAAIFVNDHPLDEQTPATITQEAGTYTIRVELEGYKCTPDQHVVRVSRNASSQFIFFTLVEEIKDRREITIRTEPIAGEIFIDSVLAGKGEAIVPHDLGVFMIHYGDVEGYVTPEPQRLTVTPSEPNPVVIGSYLKDVRFAAWCTAEDMVRTEGNVRYEVGVYRKDSGPRVSATHGSRVREIPGSQKFGWELAMGDANRNPTGGDYIEFIFDLPNGAPPSLPLALKLYLYRSNRKYPLSLSGRSEVTVTVNGRIFLDNYRPRNGSEGVELDRYEEWSLQHTLVPGENRIMIRSGQNNNVFNYLWKMEIE